MEFDLLDLYQLTPPVQKPSKQQLIQKYVPTFPKMSQPIQQQLQTFFHTIIQTKFEKKYIQQFSRKMLLQQAPLLRVHIWKMLVDCMPLNYQQWEKTKQQNSKVYQNLVKKFFTGYLDEEDLLDLIDNKTDIDKELWKEIELDSKRTHSALGYFQGETQRSKIYASKPTYHYDILSRILYLWGKTNPTIRYVQGMNEILAPIYYLQFQNPTQYSESEVFFLFNSIMTFVIDMHIKEMDKCEHGIMGRINSLNKHLKAIDYQLWLKLENEGVLPQYYAFRWLALLLAQQFPLFDLMRLWDNILSYDSYKRFFYLDCCCLAIIKIRKEFIMDNQFVHILPCLQKLKNLQVNKVIRGGTKIYDKYSRINMEKLYERIEEKIKNGEEVIVNKKKTQKPKELTEDNQGGWNYSELMKSTQKYISKWYQSRSPSQPKQKQPQKNQQNKSN